jgi:hypothetical protein
VRSGEIDSSGDHADTRTLSHTLEAAIQTLGEATCELVPVGEVFQMSSLEGGDSSGITVRCKKVSLASFTSSEGLDLLGEVAIPASAVLPPTARRLEGACDTVAVQQTQYHKLNIFFWATTNGEAESVPQEASLTRAEVRQCGALLGALQSPLKVSVAATWPEAEGASPVCLRFNDADQSWTTAGVSLDGTPAKGDSPLACITAHGAGTYAVSWLSDASQLGATFSLFPELDPLVLSFSAGSAFVACIICAICVRTRCVRGTSSDPDDIEKQISEEIMRVKSGELDEHFGRVWDLGSPRSMKSGNPVVVGTPVHSKSFGSLSRDTFDWSASDYSESDHRQSGRRDLPILTDMSDWMGAKAEDDIELAVEHTRCWGNSPRGSVAQTAPRPSIMRSAGPRKGASVPRGAPVPQNVENTDETVPWWLQVIVQV